MQHNIFLCTREFFDVYVKEKSRLLQLSLLFLCFLQT